MDGRSVLQGQIRTQRSIAYAVMGDVTQEQLAWMPPGTANKIGTILLHLVGTDDFFLARAKGEPTIWERDNWRERVGFPAPPGRGGFWAEANATTLPLAPLLEYQAAIRAALDTYVVGATSEDLQRLLPTPFGEQPIANVIGLLIVHAAGHYGEIAALKGAQGAKGLPF